MATALSLGGGCGGSLLCRSPAASMARCCATPLPPPGPDAASPRLFPASFEMTVEGAQKLLGVAEGASFYEILRAKNAVAASCKSDQHAVGQKRNPLLPIAADDASAAAADGAGSHVLESVPLFVIVLGAAHVLALVFWIYKMASQKQPIRSKTH